jgi:RNA polymerase sigma-70 factor (ECF subfamily)
VTLDTAVLTLVETGDLRGAATEAIRGLGPQVLRYLHSVLRDEDAAADAFSQFAENLWNGLPTFQKQSSLRTWAYRIAWNAALNLRNEAWNRRGRPFATGELSLLADEIRTRTVVRRARQEDALENLRRSLTVEEQSLLALRIDQALSWAEVAEVMAAEGQPVQPATLMKRFERLKTRLAEMAREQGLVE